MHVNTSCKQQEHLLSLQFCFYLIPRFISMSLPDPTMFKLVTLPDQNTLELILFPTMHSVPLSAAASDSHTSADLLTVKAAVCECSMYLLTLRFVPASPPFPCELYSTPVCIDSGGE